jgi:pyruvate/2-oxoglutarate dehydrogenase complex dihydrolipoamide dehydrogenase (E3) component
MARTVPSNYDVVIVGAGAAGLGAAREARRRGAHPVIAVDGPIGGECTFTGCVPSKALILAAARGASFDDAMGVVHQAVERIAATESAEVLRGEGIDVVEGRARLVGPDAIEVDGQTLRGRGVVIATGSVPSLPAIPGLRDADPLTNETVFQLSRRPASMVIIGGGAIGCELAQAFARLGTKVTILEAAPRILLSEEPGASELITDVLRAEGVDVRVGVNIVSAARDLAGQACLTLDEGTAVVGEQLLVAAGRRAVTDGLGLDEVGVEVDERGVIKTDLHLATTKVGVYAAGDVTARLQLTHAANRMGMIAATNVLRRFPKAKFETATMPAVVFTDPQVARVGITEAQAPATGARVAELPMTALERAIIEQRTEGFVKLIAGRRRFLGNLGGGRLLGATVVAPGAGEIVHEAALAVRTRMLTGRLAQTVHAYPTWSIAIQQAAAQLFFEYAGRSARPARPDN